MEKHEYAVMFTMEEDYWWYLGLRNIVSQCISRFANQYTKLRILDAGCGTGKILETHKNYDAYGLEFSEEAFRFLKIRRLENVIRASICYMPFKKKIFDLVISLDVLYHKSVEDDEEALAEIYRVLETGGLLILNLPAFEFLRSRHDMAIHTKRRYQKKEIRKKLNKTGFHVQWITYRNTFLFPVAIIMRLISKKRHKTKSDLYSSLPRWVNKLFYGILILEEKLLLNGVIFPFGLSVFCIARKK
ncbi:MAG: class I SAM-dependent methyltransferase [bacterium]